jgi:hypothetical protein
MESFWGSMQIELLNRQSWKTVVELSTAMAATSKPSTTPPGATVRSTN